MVSKKRSFILTGEGGGSGHLRDTPTAAPNNHSQSRGPRKPGREAGGLHKNSSAAGATRPDPQLAGAHPISSPTSLSAGRAPGPCLARWTNEGGVLPHFPPSRRGRGSGLPPSGTLAREVATCLQGWTGSSSHSHSCPGGHRGNEPCTPMPAPPHAPGLSREWGAQSKPLPPHPPPGWLQNRHLFNRMNVHGRI